MTIPMRRRWMPIALLGSVGLNLFLGGFLLGHRPHGHPPPPPERFVERVASVLPDADAAILRRALEDNRGDMDAEHQRRKTFPREIQAVLAKDPFDPEALAALFATHDKAEQQSRQRLQKALITAVGAMSPEGRHRLATLRPEDVRPEGGARPGKRP
jgi:Predicted integral membrane protein